jgi:glycine/D-amino acid oxidase-like deaminating enzyme
MSTALRLAERGADVVLLEAAYCGAGASSRNAGQLGSVPGGDPQILRLMHPRRFEGMVRLAERAVDFTEKQLGSKGIDCHYEPTGNVAAAVTPGQLKIAKQKAAIFAGAGADVRYVEGADLGLPGAFPGGMLEPAGGVLDPGRFALGLRSALLGTTARVFEGSPVSSVEPTSVGVVVATSLGHVLADRVVLAANAWAKGFTIAPKRAAAPVFVTMVETAPVDGERLAATGWSSRSGIATQHQIMESYRLTRRNTIVTGVRQLQAARGRVAPRTPDQGIVGEIGSAFRSRFPSLRDVPIDRAWGGWIAMTPSWLPVVGEVHPRVSYLVACNGHGLAQAPYLGTLLADRLLGERSHEDLAAVWRERPRFTPALMFNGPVMAMCRLDRWLDRRALGASSRRFSSREPGRASRGGAARRAPPPWSARPRGRARGRQGAGRPSGPAGRGRPRPC